MLKVPNKEYCRGKMKSSHESLTLTCISLDYKTFVLIDGWNVLVGGEIKVYSLISPVNLCRKTPIEEKIV